MPRPSQESKITEAALQCFSENGYDSTTIKDIAKRAGVTEGAIYRHYESKLAIAQSLFSLYFEQFASELQTAAQAELSLKEKLAKFLTLTLDMYRANPAAFNFVLLRQPVFRPKFPPNFKYPVEIIEAVLLQGQKEGIIRDGQPNLLAAIFLGCVMRPIIVSLGAAPGALDLIGETRHDQVIREAAWSAVVRPS